MQAVTAAQTAPQPLATPVPFNKPYVVGPEYRYIAEAVASGKLSGNGVFTQRCQQYLAQRFGFRRALLTSSCTDALEMCAILADIGPGDEVILPSYTFVSTANAFVLRGAKLVFADSLAEEPNLDANTLAALITPRTKAICVVHYAGVACDMDAVLDVARQHNLYVIEDAAQAIDSYYTGRDGQRRALGSIGHLAAFSFHETKNIISGEGGMLAVNDEALVARAEIIWEKGTNRAAFFRGEVDKYGWVDVGSSFLPSEVTAAFLWAQLEAMDNIQRRRRAIWQQYWDGLAPLAAEGHLRLPHVPAYASNNAHMFYLVLNNLEARSGLIGYLKQHNVLAVFHYLSLHSSSFYHEKHDGRTLPHTDHYSDTLLRLPLFFELTDAQVQAIVQLIHAYFRQG